jgi:uncharacterized protein
VLVLVSNCPQINNPCNGFEPTAVEMTITDTTTSTDTTTISGTTTSTGTTDAGTTSTGGGSA